jgi:hypothetical protein
MFVFHHFLPQKKAFLSPEVPEGQKRDKKIMSFECLEYKRGTKLFFWTLLIIIVKSFYLIAIQYVSLRLLLKIINLHKIS